MNRKRKVAIVVLTVFLAAGIDPFPSRSEEKLAIVHGPYLQNPGETSINVVWFTNKNCASWVEYGTGDSPGTFPKFGSLIQIAKSRSQGLIAVNTKRHAVTVEGLRPGKSYIYRVVSKEIVQFEPYEVIFGETVTSERHTFRTLEPKKPGFRFQIFQDVHGDPLLLNGLLQQPGWESNDLFFFNGDTLNALAAEEEIFNGFLDLAVSRFAADIPFVYVRGNHDTRGSLARQLDRYFPPREGKYYYSFDHGPVHFIIMDSGEDKPDDSPVYAGLVDFDGYRQEQAAWLRKEIQSDAFTKAPLRVAIFHMPPYSRGYGIEHLTKLWGPLLNEGCVDLVISGHHHRLYKFVPAEGKNAFPILGAPPDAFIRADSTASGIDLKIIDIKGNTLDSLSLPVRSKR